MKDDVEVEITDNPDKNWVTVLKFNEKSKCTNPTAATTPSNWWCDDLNTHFFRNFATTEAVGNDNKVGAVADKWEFFGWVANYAGDKWTGAVKTTIGAVKEGKVV